MSSEQISESETLKDSSMEQESSRFILDWDHGSYEFFPSYKFELGGLFTRLAVSNSSSEELHLWETLKDLRMDQASSRFILGWEHESYEIFPSNKFELRG